MSFVGVEKEQNNATKRWGFFCIQHTVVSVHMVIECIQHGGGGGVADRESHRGVADGGHLHNDYLFSGMRQKNSPSEIKQSAWKAD